MHLLTATRPISLGNLCTLAAGAYLVEDLNAAELLVMAERRAASLGPCPELPAFDPAQDWNGRHVLLMRSGGFGDLLFLGPVLRELRRRWPGIRAAVACRVPRRAVLQGLGLVDLWEDTPVRLDVARTYDAVVSFEHVIETETRRHYVDALAESIGLTIREQDRACAFVLTAQERDNAARRYPRTPFRRVAVQWSASAKARTYPPEMLAQACATLEAQGWEVFILGEPGIPARSRGNIRILANDDRPSFRESCAILTTCDVVLAPDSALLHVAGALGLPAVGLFGPIDSRMRCAYAPSIAPLKGRAPCAPCHFHQRHALEFPAGMPCQKSGRCEALAAIRSAEVVVAVERLKPA